MKIFLYCFLLTAGFTVLNGASLDYLRHSNNFAFFNNGDYTGKASISMGYCHLEMDDNANETVHVKAFNLQTNELIKDKDNIITHVNFNLLNGFSRWGHTVLFFDLVNIDKSGLADDYTKWIKLGLGYFTSPDGASLFEMGITPSIGISRIKTGRSFYKGLKIYTELDQTGFDFSLRHDLIFNTPFLDISVSNELQAIAGNDAVFFYRAKGRIDINPNDYATSATKVRPYLEFIHERSFIENYKQFNDYFMFGVELYY